MAQVKSLADGYIRETGVMSAAISGAMSCLIRHFVMLNPGTVTSIGQCAFTSSPSQSGLLGALCVADGNPVTLKLAAASTVRLAKVGATTSNGTISQPQGQGG